MNEAKLSSVNCFFDRLWENPDQTPDSAVLLVMNKKDSRRIFTPNQLRLLSFLLKKSKSMSHTEIADEIQSTASLMLRELKILEKIALVEKDEKGNWQARAAIILPEIELNIGQVTAAQATI